MTQGFFPAIETYSLTRDFGGGRGLFDLDLTVRQGEGFGFLGPNGAGKSTTIRLLMGLIHPTSGSASVLGVDVGKDPVEVKRMVGYLPGELPQFGGMRGGQVLSLLAGLRGGISGQTVKSLAERLDLDLSRHYRDYSRGNKRKLGMVAALMPKPRLLILDEPTSGLDPLVQQEFYTIIREYREAGTTLFMSSHAFAEVEHTCSRVGIIRAGRLIKQGDLTEIHSMRVHRVIVSFEGELAPGALSSLDGVSQVQLTEGFLACHVRDSFDPLLRALATVRVLNLVSQEPSLEEVFLAYDAAVAMDAAVAPHPESLPQSEVPGDAEIVPPPEPAAPVAEPEDAPAPEPEPEPSRRSFELRDWLADELGPAPDPAAPSEAVAEEPPLEQLAWTDPGPGPAGGMHPEPEPPESHPSDDRL